MWNAPEYLSAQVPGAPPLGGSRSPKASFIRRTPAEKGFLARQISAGHVLSTPPFNAAPTDYRTRDDVRQHQ